MQLTMGLTDYQAAMTVATNGRHFYRCQTCLAVVATDGMMWKTGTVECGACEGKDWEHMGRVHADHLVKDQIRCACDERCTSARGPLCSCKCGGKNHGAGMLVKLETRDAGRIPGVTPPDSAKHRAHAAEFVATRDAALAAWDGSRYAALARAKREGKWIESYREYLDGLKIRDRIHSAGRMTSQAGRMKTLRGVLAQLNPVTTER